MAFSHFAMPASFHAIIHSDSLSYANELRAASPLEP